MTIYDNFAEGIAELDRQVVSGLQCATALGRGYKDPTGDLYRDPIHVKPVAEATWAHKTLQDRFQDGEIPASGPRVYAGAAGFINLGYMAAARPAAAILFDINIFQAVFWRHIIQGLAQHDNPHDFIKYLVKSEGQLSVGLRTHFNQRADYFSGDTTPWLMRQVTQLIGGRPTPPLFRLISEKSGRMKGWLMERGSWHSPERYWLYNKSAYAHLHEMAQRGAIAPLTLDITDDAACAQLGDYLATQKQKINILYVSNIFNSLRYDTDWAGRANRKRAAGCASRNLQGLVDPENYMVFDHMPVPLNTVPLHTMRDWPAHKIMAP